MKHLNSYAGNAGTAMGIAACSVGICYALRKAMQTLWRWRTSEPSDDTGIHCPTCGRSVVRSQMDVTALNTYMARVERSRVPQSPDEWCKRTYPRMKIGNA